MPLWDKLCTVARKIYGAADITAPARVRQQIDDWQAQGYGHYPVCIAKTQSSFSTSSLPAVRMAASLLSALSPRCTS